MKQKKLIAAGMALLLISGFCFAQSLDMVKIPGRDFEMLQTEVTQKLYEQVMGKKPSYFKGEDKPVEKVSWSDAVVFCNKLSEKHGLMPVYSFDKGEIVQNVSFNGYRLPTVEEWEYCAKGGQNFKYSGSDDLNEVAWYGYNSAKNTHTVATKKPNGYGLYDMSGNVWEWCWDVYDSNDGSDRCYCGGSWCDGAYDCESNLKNASRAYFSSTYLGFRIIRRAK